MCGHHGTCPRFCGFGLCTNDSPDLKDIRQVLIQHGMATQLGPYLLVDLEALER